ncbi:MAG: hypothetical protein IPK97_08960 [Ahniella sp.]|nr:hypothetical protein [Ahniella sp.]
MRQWLIGVVCTALVVTGLFAIRGEQRSWPFERKLPYTDAAAALDLYVQQRAPQGQHEVPAHRYRDALIQRDTLPKSRALGTPDKLGTPVWQQVGPDRVGGRTRSLIFDPVDPQVMYAGAVSGGVWRSSNAGDSWQMTSDDLANLAVTTLVMEPVNRRLYAGTGEGLYVNRPASRSRGVRGDGIFISDDAGASWQQLPVTAGKTDFDYVNKLMFLPGGRLVVAARTGVWTSDDRGTTFTRKLVVPIVEGCSDLAYSEARDRVLVSCGMHSSGGIWMSGDRGESWTKVHGEDDIGRTSLAVAPSNTAVVYGLVADPTDYGMRRVIRSNDGGGTWTTQVARTTAVLNSNLLLSNFFNVEDDCRTLSSVAGAGWFHNALAVHPLNENMVFAGGVDLFRSNDGGRTFAPISRWHLDITNTSYAHADQHVITFEPAFNGNDRNRMYVANDGGIQSTDNPDDTAGNDVCSERGIEVRWQNRNAGYFVSQYYHGSVSEDLSRVAGGMQDNGTFAGPAATTPQWGEIYGGDGAYTLIDPRSANVIYFASQWANFRRSLDGGASNVGITNGIIRNNNDFLFITPMAIDPIQPDTLYTGGRVIYRTANRGTNWRAISSSTLDPDRGILSAIAVSEFNNLRVAVGFNSGTIVVTSNANATTPTWTVSKPRAGFVSSVTVDPLDQNRLFATYSNFGGNKVYRSLNGGQTWEPIDGTETFRKLPDVPAHDLLIDPRDRSRLLLATDIGVFIGHDNGAVWSADASGLGNVLVERLQAVRSGSDYELFAFTYGRGIFRTRLSSLPAPTVNPGWSGLWTEAGVDGQGMQLLALPDSGQLLMSWYTHLPTGARQTRTRDLGLLGLGNVSGGSVTIPVSAAPDGVFDAADPSAQQPLGSVTLSFTDCARGQAVYDLTIDSVRVQGTIPLTRLTPDTVCESFRTLGEGAISVLPRPASPESFQYGHTGAWHDATKPGQGFLFEAMPNQNQLIATWFTYDFADVLGTGRQSPLWLAAIGPMTGASSDLQVILTTGGQFDAASPVTNSVVGTLRINSQSCLAATATYSLTLNGVPRTGTIPLSRITAGSLCR